MTEYIGPCKINCKEQCDVPAGFKFAVMPPSRHKWNDILRCPNEGCGLEFLAIREQQAGPRSTL